MKDVRTFLRKHVLFSSVLITLITFSPMFAVNYFHLQFTPVNYNIVVRLWPACILMCLMKWLHLNDLGVFSLKRVKKAFRYGWIAIVFSIGLLLSGLADQSIRESLTGTSGDAIAVYVFEMFCVGMLEEILARGIIFGLMRNAWQNQTNGLYRAAIASGTIFGMMHLINLFGGAGICATFSQIIYAAFIGVYFAAVYMKCDSMWGLVLLHALIDLCGGFFDYFSQEKLQSESVILTDITMIQAMSNIIITVPFIVWAIYTIYKYNKKTRDYLSVSGSVQKNIS